MMFGVASAGAYRSVDVCKEHPDFTDAGVFVDFLRQSKYISQLPI
jgi:hypothetical protein